MSHPNPAVQPKNQSPSRRGFWLLLIPGLLLLILAVYHTGDYFYQHDRIVRQAKEDVRHKTDAAIEKMNAHFAKLKGIADEFAVEFDKRKFSKAEIETMVYRVVRQNPEVFGFCVAYEPYQHDRTKRLYAPFCYRKNRDIQQIQVETIYDYTQPEGTGRNWYLRALSEGAGWSEPYFGSASASLLANYSLPFYGPGGSGQKKPIGVVAITYSLDEIKGFTGELGLLGNGYSYILSKQGFFISHPNKEYVSGQKNIREIFVGPKNREAIAQINEALAGKPGLIEHHNELTGQNSWIMLKPIRSTGYIMGTVFIKNTVVNHKDYTRSKLITISLFFIPGVFLLLLLLFKTYRLTPRSLWKASISLTVLLMAEIVFIWILALNDTNYTRPNALKVVDEVILHDFINTHEMKSQQIHELPPIFIRTGVFVQSLQFENANNVKVTGYIWQKFPRTFPADVSEGFILPEAVSSNIQKAYSRDWGGVRTEGWRFEAVLRQSFEYFKYPFDNKDVWLRIWPRDFDKNVILIPDLASYKLLHPGSLPGIAQGIVLPGWKIEQSFFSLVPGSYNSNFGIDKYTGQDNFPELHYSVVVDREFLNPFISNLLPFAVIVLVLFGTLILISGTEEKASKFKTSISGILASCAGLIFSVIIAHSQLRNSIAADGILYMEYFYFVLYAAIIFVITNAFLITFESQIKLVRYQDNLLPKILLVPSLLTVLLIVTVTTFY